MAYYVFDEKLCKFESMTKEQIINAIAQATGVTPSDVDQGFISTIIENNRSSSIHVWKGTRAEYNALATKSFNTLYVIDDDTTIADLTATVNNAVADVQELADQMVDTNWQDIWRYTVPDNDPVIIGKYRVIGKIAFITLYYDLSDFTSTLTHDEFQLPIRLDIQVQTYIAIPYSNSSNQITIAGAKFTNGTTGNTTMTILANENVDHVRVTFSFPISSDV